MTMMTPLPVGAPTVVPNWAMAGGPGASQWLNAFDPWSGLMHAQALQGLLGKAPTPYDNPDFPNRVNPIAPPQMPGLMQGTINPPVVMPGEPYPRAPLQPIGAPQPTYDAFQGFGYAPQSSTGTDPQLLGLGAPAPDANTPYGPHGRTTQLAPDANTPYGPHGRTTEPSVSIPPVPVVGGWTDPFEEAGKVVKQDPPPYEPPPRWVSEDTRPQENVPPPQPEKKQSFFEKLSDPNIQMLLALSGGILSGQKGAYGSPGIAIGSGIQNMLGQMAQYDRSAYTRSLTSYQQSQADLLARKQALFGQQPQFKETPGTPLDDAKLAAKGVDVPALRDAEARAKFAAKTARFWSSHGFMEEAAQFTKEAEFYRKYANDLRDEADDDDGYKAMAYKVLDDGTVMMRQGKPNADGTVTWLPDSPAYPRSEQSNINIDTTPWIVQTGPNSGQRVFPVFNRNGRITGWTDMDGQSFDPGEHKIIPKWTPTPDAAIRRYEETGEAARLATHLAADFKDEYAGFPVEALGKFQEFVERRDLSVFPKAFETWRNKSWEELRGMADFWQQETEQMMQKRAELFGANLSKFERADFMETQIKRTDSPEFVKRKLNRRRHIIARGIAATLEQGEAGERNVRELARALGVHWIRRGSESYEDEQAAKLMPGDKMLLWIENKDPITGKEIGWDIITKQP